MEADDEQKRSDSPIIVPELSMWESVPSDVLAFSWTFLDLRDVLRASRVCRVWNAASFNRVVWNRFCAVRSWPRLGKAEFIDKYTTTEMYMRFPTSQVLNHTCNGAVFALYCPKPKRYVSYTSGKLVTDDDAILVSGHGPPRPVFAVWDLTKGACLRDIKSQGWSVADISEECTVVAQGRDMMAIELDRTVKFYRHHTSTITCVRVSAGQQRRAVSSGYDATVRVWDTLSGRQITVFHGHADKVWAVDIHPNESLVLSAGDDMSVIVWDVDGARSPRYVLKGHTACVMVARFDTYDPDTYIVSAGYDTTVRLWNYREQQCLRVFEGHSDVVFTLQITPHIIMSAGRDRDVVVWERCTGKRLKVLKGHTADVKCSALLPDGSLATAGFDCSVRVWKFPRRQERVRSISSQHLSSSLSSSSSSDTSCVVS